MSESTKPPGDKPPWVRSIGAAGIANALTLLAVLVSLISLGIAFQQTRISETALRSVQRAFVSVREVATESIGSMAGRVPGANSDIGYRIALVWENSGGTPTRDLVVGTGIALADRATSMPQYVWPQASGRQMILLPSARAEEGDITVTGRDLNSVRDGDLKMTVYGFAAYADVFSIRHLTLSCFELKGDHVDYTQSGHRRVRARQCAKFNCTDDECRRYREVEDIRKLLAYVEDSRSK